MMNKIRFSIIALFCTLSCMAYAQDYVDLGLSVKWCTVNTGVTADRPYGEYYRWPDAMAIKTTDGSRMATKAEWDELRDLCTWKWTEQNGVAGYLVTSKIKGYTGRSIFLPAAGWLNVDKLNQAGTYASYWTSTPGMQPDNESAYGFNFKRGSTEWHSENREAGQSVRMVMPLEGKEITNLSIDHKKLYMEQGSTARLGVSMSGGKRNVNSTCTWKSSDEKVVKVVDDGLLVATGPGSCNVQVTAYGKTAGCAVTVTPRENEYVDLGLSVLWATCNLGATAPQEYGNYYAWAEIESKDFFSWGNYRYCSFPQHDGMDKYTVNGLSHNMLKADNLDRLEPTDDAATVLLGDGWRIPTTEEFRELVENSTFDIQTVGGVEGIRFTSKVPGFENRSIFIPYSGEMDGNEPVERGKNVFLWSSTAERGTNGGCFSTKSDINGMMMMEELSPIEVLEMTMQIYRGGDESRYKGMNIRPIRSLTDDMFKSLSLPAKQMDLGYGQVRRIEAMMMPSGRPVNPTSVTWSSSDPSVISFNTDGSLTAVGQGRCVITAESGGRKAQMTVDVALPVPEPVDLGLSVMWASANLGASEPDEPGGYFMWGETSPRAGLYTGDKYKYGQYVNATSKYNFYTSNWGGSDYPLDYKESLDPDDDAAMVLLGDGWRMPTADELWELKTKCIWEAKIVQDTVEYNFNDTVELFFEKRLLGYVITSNIPGYEDRSIYLPATGFIGEYVSGNASGLVMNKGNVYYWTSTLNQSLGNSSRRYNGFAIRPVKELPESESRGKVEADPVKPLKHNAMVDLGLSLLWADCNVGADKPEELGARFAWGETTQKTYYSETNYKYMAAYKDANKWWYSKYIPFKENSNDPYKDGKTRLDLEDDAARANWGGKWRMPTKEDYKELYEKCEWKEDSVNGVKGYRITSKVPGYTQNSIFLPYNSGYGDTPVSMVYENGCYLTSDLSSGYTDRCVVMEFSEYEFGTTDEVELDFGEAASSLGGSIMSKIHVWARGRTSGYYVRAVCDK